MKILVDMNLSPTWIPLLKKAGHDAIHWIDIGKPNAKDSIIMEWAATREFIIFTHDLDFGTMISLTNAEKPSIFQIRTQDVNPSHLGDFVLSILVKYKDELEKGALLVVDEDKLRVRILPLRK
jgi:predicted nuclease of predicted toxin-antitoxin system